MKKSPAILCILLLFSVSSSTRGQSDHANLNHELRQLTQQLKLIGIPHAQSKIPSIESPLSQLGMMLFYSKSLGGQRDTACVSCHHPLLGGGDNLSIPIGVNAQYPDILGPQRALKKGHLLKVPRNAPSTFNIAFYKKSLFHDGRIQHIKNKETFGITTPDVVFLKEDMLSGEDLVQAQARFPIISAAEMRGDFMPHQHNQTVRKALADRLKNNWLVAFRKGFSEPKSTAEDLITEQNISAAIAEYEKSQVFTRNPWSQYLRGDNNAISLDAKKGALLFYKSSSDGGANCSHCHSGDFFTDESFHNTAMPQIGIGKGEGITTSNDYGCWSVTKKLDDKFRFRTPTLLNVEVTGPWGHNGAFTTLEGITRHMLSPLDSLERYNPNTLKQKGINTAHIKAHSLEAIQSGVEITPIKNLTKQDVSNIVMFLKTLTDPCVKSRECLSPWIPNKMENDPDGLMLHALSGRGKRL